MAIKNSRASRAKRTKEALIDELEALEAKVSTSAVYDPTALAVAKERKVEVLTAAGKLSVDAIVANGAKFGLDVQRTVADLTEQAVAKAEELKVLQEAIAAETAELERLYDIDVAEASVDVLLSEYRDRRNGLDAEIAQANEARVVETLAYQKKVAQRAADDTASRVREQQEYDYKTQQERTKATEAFAYKLQTQERDTAVKLAQVETEISARYRAVEADEVKWANERARLVALDVEIKKASEAAVAIATNSLKKELTAQSAIEKLGLENQIALKNADIISERKTVTGLTNEVLKLQQQLTEARQEVKEIAKSAVEGASGQVALSKIMEVRQESNGQQKRS